MPAINTKRRSAPLPAMSPQQSALQKVAQNFAIELAPFPDGDAALAFKTEAAQIVVADHDSHRAALEALKRGKALKRGIDEHWRKVLRWLEDRKQDIRTIMNTDLELVDPGLATLGKSCLSFEAADDERIRREEAQKRIENERIAREARERELASMEQQALVAEASSEDLSARERVFVQQVYAGTAPVMAAKVAGFADPTGASTRLMKTGKIAAAIEGMRQASAIRQQSAAVAQAPVEAKKVEVQSNLAKVSGTRTVTTFTGECFNYRLFVEEFKLGNVDIDTFCEMSEPSVTGGNAKARALKANLDRIPGWRHIRTDTKAG